MSLLCCKIPGRLEARGERPTELADSWFVGFVLKACGAQEALENAGVMSGDTVVIGSVDLEWSNASEQEALEDFQMNAGKQLKGTRHWPTVARG
eukprot:740610-Prorocentrum_minimum.AAC.1